MQPAGSARHEKSPLDQRAAAVCERVEDCELLVVPVAGGDGGLEWVPGPSGISLASPSRVRLESREKGLERQSRLVAAGSLVAYSDDSDSAG